MRKNQSPGPVQKPPAASRLAAHVVTEIEYQDSSARSARRLSRMPLTMVARCHGMLSNNGTRSRQ